MFFNRDITKRLNDICDNILFIIDKKKLLHLL